MLMTAIGLAIVIVLGGLCAMLCYGAWRLEERPIAVFVLSMGALTSGVACLVSLAIVAVFASAGWAA